MQIIPAEPSHIPTIAQLRVALLEETGGALPVLEREALLQSNQAFYRDSLASPDWHTLVAVFGDVIGAAGSLALWRRPPYPGNPSGLDAYILNMYTLPAFRGRGAATAIVRAMLAHAAVLKVPKVVLHATEAGRPIYTKVGFLPSGAYMELVTAQATLR